jgi:hypothetical protein
VGGGGGLARKLETFFNPYLLPGSFWETFCESRQRSFPYASTRETGDDGRKFSLQFGPPVQPPAFPKSWKNSLILPINNFA